jgi:predicted nucleotidyltransferase
MRRTGPALLPVFRSRLQADILAALLLHPDREISLTDLARQVGAPLTTVHGEAERLTDAGILARRQAGRSAMLRADPASRLTRPLTDLLVLSWGPQHVIAEEFASLDGAERVLIFGSWAARYHEQPGPQPNDVDVLVIGAPSRDNVYDAADRAQQRLGIPVNTIIRPPAAWHDQADPLIRQIQASPVVEVLSPDEASRATGGNDG